MYKDDLCYVKLYSPMNEIPNLSITTVMESSACIVCGCYKVTAVPTNELNAGKDSMLKLILVLGYSGHDAVGNI